MGSPTALIISREFCQAAVGEPRRLDHHDHRHSVAAPAPNGWHHGELFLLVRQDRERSSLGQGGQDGQSKNPASSSLRAGACSLRTAFASICRIRSRVTLKMWPTSSSV